MPSQVWIYAAIAATAIVGLTAVLLWWRGNRRPSHRLPQEWPLMQRPVFSWEERALFRQLRAALPNHTVLAKLPLVRFCQPIERRELRYWFELLGPIHVSFVVCANNGRALAAIDIDKPERKTSERTLAIKQAVLEACHIRYVKCRADQLPTIAELQLLVPSQGEQARPQVPSPFAGTDQHSTLAETVRGPQRGRAEDRWRESGFASDSFFAPDGAQDDLDDRASDLPSSRFPRDAAAQPARESPRARASAQQAATAPILHAPPVAPPPHTESRPARSASTPQGTTERRRQEDTDQQALREELRRDIRQNLQLEIPTPARRPHPAPSASPAALDLRLDPRLRPPLAPQRPTAAQTPKASASGSVPGEFGPNITPLHRAAASAPRKGGDDPDGGPRFGRR